MGNNTLDDKRSQKIVSIIVFIAGLAMIILFIVLAAQKVNEIILKPGNVIYNNPPPKQPLTEEIDQVEEELEKTVFDEPEDLQETGQNDETETPEEEVQGVSTSWWSYPENIVDIPIDEVFIDTVVDKGHKLSEYYVPPGLTPAYITGITSSEPNRPPRLIPDVVNALNELGEAAQADGITNLHIVSSYRSYQDQVVTYQRWLDYNGGIADYADQVSARPGHSEHQLGTVVDFSTTETLGQFEQFQYTEAYQWLLENAKDYGFRQSYPEGMEQETGYSAEAWHWRWWGL